MEYSEILKRQFRMALMIAVQGVFAFFIYGFVAFKSIQDSTISTAGNVESLRVILYVCAIFALGGMNYIKNVFKKRGMPNVAQAESISEM